MIDPFATDRSARRRPSTTATRPSTRTAGRPAPTSACWAGRCPPSTAARGLDPLTAIMACEALGYGCADNGLVFAVNNHLWACVVYLLDHGTDGAEGAASCRGCADGIADRRARPDRTGDRLGHAALTHVAPAPTATATVLDGTKMFISNGPVADLFVVFARTGDDGAGPSRRCPPSWCRATRRADGPPDITRPGCAARRWASSPSTSCRGARREPARRGGHRLPGVHLDHRVGARLHGRSQVGRCTGCWTRCVEHAGGRGSSAARSARSRPSPTGSPTCGCSLELARLMLYKFGWLKSRAGSRMLEAVDAQAVRQREPARRRAALDAMRIHGARGYSHGPGDRTRATRRAGRRRSTAAPPTSSATSSRAWACRWPLTHLGPARRRRCPTTSMPLDDPAAGALAGEFARRVSSPAADIRTSSSGSERIGPRRAVAVTDRRDRSTPEGLPSKLQPRGAQRHTAAQLATRAEGDLALAGRGGPPRRHLRASCVEHRRGRPGRARARSRSAQPAAGRCMDGLDAADARHRGAASSARREFRYPTLIPIDALHRCGYFDLLPAARDVRHPAARATGHLPRLPGRRRPDTRPRPGSAWRPARRRRLLPAADHVLPHVPPVRGPRLPADRSVVTARGKSFRHEARYHRTPGAAVGLHHPRDRLPRLRATTCSTARDVPATGVLDLIDELGLSGRCEVANDPFFGDRRRRARVVPAAAGAEVRAAADVGPADVAVGSFNFHESFFGESFGIRPRDGRPAAQRLRRFGLERLAYALLCQHGRGRGDWPDPLVRDPSVRTERSGLARVSTGSSDRHVGVLGAGTMGIGVGHAFAAGGPRGDARRPLGGGAGPRRSRRSLRNVRMAAMYRAGRRATPARDARPRSRSPPA